MTSDRVVFRPVPQRPIVRGQRVWLRPLDEGDLEAFAVAINEHDPGWWAGYPGALGMRQLQKWFEDTVCKRHGDDSYFFAISPLGSDEFLGQLRLWNIDQRVPGAEISISVVTPGTGVGTDAIDAAVDFGFETLKLRRIWGFTHEWNERSVAAFERCGFVVEGRMRGAAVAEGGLADMIQFSMTVDDWRSLDRAYSWELNDPDHQSREPDQNPTGGPEQSSS